jgi:dienelactone hydrolase
MVGAADTYTPSADAEALHRRYSANNVDNELMIVPGRVHGFEAAPADWQWSYEKMRDFFRLKLA